MDGVRKCLADEFSNIYILNMRGDIRKNILSKGAAKEGQNIFSGSSMTGIAISFLVKNPEKKEHGKIYYHDIGDDLRTQDKLAALTDFFSIEGVTTANGWLPITPDKHSD